MTESSVSSTKAALQEPKLARATPPKEATAKKPRGKSASHRVEAVLERVQSLLQNGPAPREHFFPKPPADVAETGLGPDVIERLVVKFLFNRGTATGRDAALQLRLPFPVVEPFLRSLKQEHLVGVVGAGEFSDYEYCITDHGRDRARRYVEESSYFGAAPVPLGAYLKAMATQSIAGLQVTRADLLRAFEDLLINREMLDQLGPAINSGRGMFLFGAPGNGKTSIAERITRCFGSEIWIPRALAVDGEIIRLFDPGLHEELPLPPTDGLLEENPVDGRWVRIVRPTVFAGGELTMDQLEVTQNQQTKICEAPLQLKSNCGTFVIDDFGRQRVPVTDLLNRWIVPLEKRYDFLNLPSGKKIQVPFDQLIIFSTNLEPRDLVDGAFLRRIPYKIQVQDPTETEFREILRRLCPRLGFQYNEDAVNHLIETHYRAVNRPFRSCQPRDLLLQVKNQCSYLCLEPNLSREGFDFAVANYFSVM